MARAVHPGTHHSIAHALFHTYELSIPLFVGIWMDELGASATLIGVVAGYGFIGVGTPTSGVLAERFGFRRLILASIVGMGAGFALVASLARLVLTNATNGDLFVVLTAVAATGVGFVALLGRV